MFVRFSRGKRTVWELMMSFLVFRWQCRAEFDLSLLPWRSYISTGQRGTIVSILFPGLPHFLTGNHQVHSFIPRRLVESHKRMGRIEGPKSTLRQKKNWPLASISDDPAGLVFLQCMTESVRHQITKSVHYAYECVTSYLTSVQSGWSMAYVHCRDRRSQIRISYVNSYHCSRAVNQWSVVGISDAAAAAERSQLRAP